MNKRQCRNSKSKSARFIALDDTALQNIVGGNADDTTIQHALELYNAMTTAIRDVVTRAKLTPIGEILP